MGHFKKFSDPIEAFQLHEEAIIWHNAQIFTWGLFKQFKVCQLHILCARIDKYITFSRATAP